MYVDPDTIVRNIGYYVQMKRYKKGIDSLSAVERIFFVVYDFDCEVQNGGVDQYLFNSSGDYANEVPSSLKVIGAIKTSEIVSKLLSLFPEQKVPDEGDRLPLLKTWMDNVEYKQLEKSVTHEYSADEEKIFSRLYAYYENNRQKFAPLDFDVPFCLFECEYD